MIQNTEIAENTSLEKLTVADLKNLVNNLIKENLLQQESRLNGYVSPEKVFDPTAKPISEIAAELAAEITDSDWEGLPTNASELVDEYLYGIPHK